MPEDFAPDGSDGSRFDDLKPFYTETPDVCGNCGKPCEQTVYVPGFDYFGCDDCAEEAKITIYAEDNCPALYRAIMRANLVSEVQRAFRWHKETCPNCNPKISKMEPGREIPKERAA